MQPTPRVKAAFADPSIVADVASMIEALGIFESVLVDTGANLLLPDFYEGSMLIDWLFAYLDDADISFHLCSHDDGEAGTVDCTTVPTYMRLTFSPAGTVQIGEEPGQEPAP